MSPKPKQATSPTETNSVTNAPVKWFPGAELDQLHFEMNVTKCSTCNMATKHLWVKVGPLPVAPEGIDPIEAMKLNKRLTMCTHCGTLRLIT